MSERERRPAIVAVDDEPAVLAASSSRLVRSPRAGTDVRPLAVGIGAQRVGLRAAGLQAEPQQDRAPLGDARGGCVRRSS